MRGRPRALCSVLKMARHRISRDSLLRAFRRRYWLLIVMFLFSVFVAGSISLGRSPIGAQVAAVAISIVPLGLGYVCLFRYESFLTRESGDRVIENLMKIWVIVGVGAALAIITRLAGVPSAASGTGLLIAGLVAVFNWSLLVEIFMKCIFDHNDSIKRAAES